MVAASLALASTTAAHAATDSGLHFQDNRGAGIRNGIGAEMAVKLRFGSRRTVYPSDRFNLRIGAGPVVSTLSGRMSTPRMFSAILSPGYKANISLAGRSLTTRYTASGLAEAKARGIDIESRQGVSTLGYVAIGVGALVVATAATFALIVADISDCSDGNCE
jgi:hypothetical protein